MLAKSVDLSTVTVGVRPENLIICPEGTANAIRAEIKVTEMMGSEIHIHAAYGAEAKKIILKVQIADMTDEEQRELLSRKELWFTLRERTINLFDPESGCNLAVDNAVPVPKTVKAAEPTKPEKKEKKKKK